MQNQQTISAPLRNNITYSVISIIISFLLALYFGFHYYYSVSNPYETYYRLVVDLSDTKDRKVGIDIVVGCGIRRGHIIGGGFTFDVMSMDSAVYAWAIPDGHALSVRTSPAIAGADTCSGSTTDNGRIARDWLPFIVWYDDASDLSYGLGYATQDAYTNPRAKLKFESARITRATSEDYRAFKANGPPNLLPRYLSDVKTDYTSPDLIYGGAKITAEMIKNPRMAWRISDKLTCRGVIRTPIPLSLQSELAEFRPTTASKYWSPISSLPRALRAQIPRRDETYDGSFMRPPSPEWDSNRPRVYSQSFDGNLNTISSDTFASGSFREEAKIIPENLGFMDCGRMAPPPLASAVTGRSISITDHHQITCLIDGIQVDDTARCSPTTTSFENLDYVLTQTRRLKE